MGAKGVIGSTYTFAAPLYLNTNKLFQANKIELARKQHSYLLEMGRIVAHDSSIHAQRANIKMLEWDLGPSRLPSVTLSKAQYDRLYNELSEISFFEKLQSSKN